MSFSNIHHSEHERATKRRIQRRHGACEPCRSSKTKCDGRIPCGACRSERRRQCPCVYSEKVMKLQQVTAEMRRRAESDQKTGEPLATTPPANNETRQSSQKHIQEGPMRSDYTDPNNTRKFNNQSDPSESDMGIDSIDAAHADFRPLSLSSAVDEFKQLKAARGVSAQVIGRCDGFEAINISSTVPAHQSKDGTSSENSPTWSCNAALRQISRLALQVKMVQQTIRQGYLVRAWIDIASVIRESEVIESSHNDALAREDSHDQWKQIQDEILDVESQLGIVLGRPICLLSRPQSERNLRPLALPLKDDDLESTRYDLYQHIQSILALQPHNSSTLASFLDQAQTILSHEPFNQVGLCTTKEDSMAAREVQFSVHLLFMTVYCRLASMCDTQAREGNGPIYLGDEAVDTAKTMGLNQPRQKLAYCRKMFRSANFVLSIFIDLYSEAADSVCKNWMRCHGAFIAATLLGIAKLRYEVEWDSTTGLLRNLEQIFISLAQKDVRCELFKVAVNRLQDLNSVKEPTSEVTRHKHSGVKNRKRFTAVSSQTGSASTVQEPGNSAEPDHKFDSPAKELKRNRDEMEASCCRHQDLSSSFHSNYSMAEDVSPLSVSSMSLESSVDHLALFHGGAAGIFSQPNSFISDPSMSATTSFCESDAALGPMAEMALTHPGPPFAFPFPYDTIHPPMLWNNLTLPSTEHNAVQPVEAEQQFVPVSQSLKQSRLQDGQMLTRPSGKSVAKPGHESRNPRAKLEPSKPTTPNHAADNAHNKDEYNKDSDMIRQHSTASIGLGQPKLPTTINVEWSGGPATGTNEHSEFVPQNALGSDAGRSHMGHHTSRLGPYFVPMTTPMQLEAAASSQQLFEATHPPTPHEQHPYFGTSIDPSHDEGRLISPLRQQYTFSCQQQGYVQGQEQWRQMSVGAGGAGGPGL